MTTEDSNSDDPCVAVIGMGRSGTSATAGLLVNLGLSGPRGDDLLPAMKSNESGHWESRSVIRCNGRLLRSVGADDHAPPPITLNWDQSPEYASTAAAAQRWYEDAHGGGPVMVKDPRMCYTVGFWRKALPAPMAALFVLRNPIEVARSVKTRDGLPMSLGLSVWDRSVRSAALGLQGLPILVLRYDKMLSEPLEGTAKVVEFLDQLGIPVSADAVERASSWFDPKLQHERSELDEYTELASVQLEIFEQLSSCAGIHSSWAPPTSFPDPPLWVDDCIELRRRHRRLRMQLKQIQRSRTYRVASVVEKARNRLR
jgi:hypothetical protein